MAKKGKIVRVAGPVVHAKDVNASMYDVVRVGEEQLIGEVIKIVGNISVVQVYEDTSGLKPGDPVVGTGLPLAVELGPGILKNIYDGIQRPLDVIAHDNGTYIQRGAVAPPLDRKKKWTFKPLVKKGDKVKQGSIIGTVKETHLIEHRILSPYDGTVKSIKEGSYTVDDVIGELEHLGQKKELKLSHRWPVRKARPFAEKYPPTFCLQQV